MENDILDSLQDIKYEGPMKDENNLKKAVEGGPKNIEYSKLVNYISNEIKSVCPLEESINPISSSEDSSSFLMEVSSFLKELGCPYTCLTTGHLSERLRSTADKLLLLEYLLGELMSARMIKVDKPDENNKMEVQLHESETAKYLKEMLLTLQFNKPPPNITPAMLFSKVESKLKETVNRAGSELIGKPAFNGYLSDKQWHTLSEIQKDLNADYTIRRELLLKRLDVTIQSFQWSDKTKGKEELIKNLYNSKAGSLKKNPEIDLGDLLAARDDILIIEKTSSASVRKNTQSSVNKVIIGRVPDRGGRPSEQAPPPPEMPSWQQQRQPSGGRGGGRGGGDRGNYSQGGGGYTRGGSQGGSGGGGGYNRGGLQSGGGYNRDDSSRDYSGNQNRDYGNSGYSGGQNRTSGGNSGGSSYGQGGYDRGGYNRGGNYQQNYQQQTLSYADQYVQDSYHNQQYGSRGDSGRNSGGRGGRGGGRSNYSRGGGGSGSYR